MSQTDSPERERVSAQDLEAGDRVFMGINLHGTTDNVPGTEYDRGIHQSGVEGVVTEALSEMEKTALEAGERPMANLTVETDDGETFTWNVDNGYVLGYHAEMGRRTDVGKIGGFYTA